MAKVIGWRGVTSRCLRAMRHNADTNELDVEFRKSGAQYRYYGVSARKSKSLEGAKSIGRYFVYKVREAYDYRKLRAGKRSGRKRKR